MASLLASSFDALETPGSVNNVAERAVEFNLLLAGHTWGTNHLLRLGLLLGVDLLSLSVLDLIALTVCT